MTLNLKIKYINYKLDLLSFWIGSDQFFKNIDLNLGSYIGVN